MGTEAQPVTPATILTQLDATSVQLRSAESKYYEAVNVLAEAKYRLLERECELNVQGRNEYERNTKLWPQTKNLHRDITKAEYALDVAKVELHYLQRKYDILELATKLMAAK